MLFTIHASRFQVFRIYKTINSSINYIVMHSINSGHIIFNLLVSPVSDITAFYFWTCIIHSNDLNIILNALYTARALTTITGKLYLYSVLFGIYMDHWMLIRFKLHHIRATDVHDGADRGRVHCVRLAFTK